MATIHAIPSAPVPVAAVSRILAGYDRPKLEAFISIAIDLLDTLDGDPDAEDRDPDLEPDGDDRDLPWPEWHPRNSALVTTGLIGDLEDDENDDPAEDGDSDYCLAGEDRIIGGSVIDPGLMREASGVGDEADHELSEQECYTGPKSPG